MTRQGFVGSNPTSSAADKGRFHFGTYCYNWVMNKEIVELEKRVREIELRNRRVESDKAWETSTFRKVLLVLFTYLAIGLYMNAIHISRPWLNAIVPAVGFFLSTLTLPYFKKWWIENFYKKTS